ncbi:class I cytochrome c [Hylemonella gracilis str. Niagara R]|uniref:Class I cytochrome c n=1 Tax=Hylemonella gracilis str. Niagara R TaxID=1458275 RepID=A0A016XI05_9BURK|nr:c-type cytochrome [Hylemonella gracilis]EYC51182.1 class I cytochrome c [Hylemonella gracilis str. Niagara R]
MKKFLSIGSILLLAVALSTSAAAQGVDTQVRVWAASCAACHGTNGAGGPARGAIPVIAGQDKTVLLQKLLAYKKGELQATVMHQHAKGYSDGELERLAAFFAAQKP